MTGAVRRPVRGKEKVDALSRHGRHGPGGRNESRGVSRATPHSSIASRAAQVAGSTPSSRPAGRLQGRRVRPAATSAGARSWRTRRASRRSGIVGQHRYGVAVVLDLALDFGSIRQPQPGHAEAAPALVHGAERHDARGAAYDQTRRLQSSRTSRRVCSQGMVGCQPSSARARAASPCVTATSLGRIKASSRSTRIDDAGLDRSIASKCVSNAARQARGEVQDHAARQWMAP